MSQSLLTRLTAAWVATPTLTFGQLVESVENVAWDLYHAQHPTRQFSARLAHMPDNLMEAALDQWVRVPFVRKAVVL